MSPSDFNSVSPFNRRPSLLTRTRPQTAAPDKLPPMSDPWAASGLRTSQSFIRNTDMTDSAAESGYDTSNGDDDQGDYSVLEEISAFPEPTPRQRAVKSFSSLRHSVDGLRALGRRLSVTMRRRSSKSGSQPSIGHSHAEDRPARDPAPLRPDFAAKSSSFKRFSINRRPSLHSISALQTFYAPKTQEARSIPPAEDSQPSFCFGDILGGAAARAAAATHNDQSKSYLELSREDSKLCLSRDSESGINIDLRDNSHLLTVELAVVRHDPIQHLPSEIVALVLSYLDPESLKTVECISRAWNEAARSHHVWRAVFRTKYGRCLRGDSYHAKTQSLGLGKTLPNQDWKRMFLVRQALEHRWKEGKAAAIYLHGHRDSVYCVQFDEHKIITGSRDRTIRVWDAHYPWPCLKIIGAPWAKGASNMATEIAPAQISQSSGSSPFLAICPPNRGPANSSSSGSVSEYHNASILCLQFDDEIMVTGSSDHSCIVWDMRDDYKFIRRLSGHRGGVLDVCMDDRYIVSCSKDTTICVWDRQTGELVKKLLGHFGPVNAVQLRGDLVVSASGDGVARLWNITSGLCVKEFPCKDRGLACIEFSADARYILAGGNEKTIYQFDANTGELVKSLKGHTGLVRSLHLDDLNRRIVSGSYDMSIKVFDAESGELSVDLPGWTTSWMLSAKSDYRRIVATSQDSRAVIIDFGYGIDGIDLLEE